MLSNSVQCYETAKLIAGHTRSEAKLSAGYMTINYVPRYITDSAPRVIIAHLYTAFRVICSIYQSEVTISTI